jgi:hypothetical protein
MPESILDLISCSKILAMYIHSLLSFFAVILAYLDPDPDPADLIQCRSNADPDQQYCNHGEITVLNINLSQTFLKTEYILIRSMVQGCEYDIYKVQSNNEHIFTQIHSDS